MPKRCEGDLFAVRRVGGFGIVARRVGQTAQSTAISPGRKDVELVVVVPGVTALFSGSAKLDFGLLLRFCFQVMVSRGKEDFVCARPKERARCLADPG